MALAGFERLLVTTGSCPQVVSVSNALLTLNEALSHSAVLVQVTSRQPTGGGGVWCQFMGSAR